MPCNSEKVREHAAEGNCRKGLNRSANLQRLNIIIMKKLTSVTDRLFAGAGLERIGATASRTQSPSKGKRAPEKRIPLKHSPDECCAASRPRSEAAAGAMKEHGAINERGATNQPGAEKGQKTHATTSRRTPQMRTSPLNRPVKRRLSPVLEKAGRVGLIRNLQILPRPERMFPVMRQECRRRSGRSSRLRSGSKVGSTP